MSPRRNLGFGFLLFGSALALLPIQFTQAGLAPMWLGRFISSVCHDGAIDWAALGCCGLHIWARVELVLPSLVLFVLQAALMSRS
jgi:hypothetical protein